jgi:hypothetical protein
MPHGKIPNGKIPYGKMLNGQMPYGKMMNGKMPHGKMPDGQMPCVEMTYCDFKCFWLIFFCAMTTFNRSSGKWRLGKRSLGK